MPKSLLKVMTGNLSANCLKIITAAYLRISVLFGLRLS